MMKLQTLAIAAVAVLALSATAHADVERQTTLANGQVVGSQSNYTNNGNGTYTHNQAFEGANGNDHYRSVTVGNGQRVTSNTYANAAGASHTVTRTRAR